MKKCVLFGNIPSPGMLKKKIQDFRGGMRTPYDGRRKQTSLSCNSHLAE